ncbi:MAG: hypothetical protein Q7T18_04465 [Sedimentisphaerales bacterium]|nr:hypothetical protein [Sedimentisphaerales bacterium]
MNPMKWMRKNKPKIMAIVVVLIMIAFTVPTLISQWQRPGIKGDKPIAHYYNKKGTISNDDIRNAQNDLNLLKSLGAEMFLQSRPSLMQTADIPALALAQTLFTESRTSPMIEQEIKRIVREFPNKTGMLMRLTDGQIDDFFRQQSTEKPEILWLLLNAEAKAAGFAVSNQDAGATLKAIIPQMPQMRGATAEQVLKSIIDRQGVDQDTILRTFADLLAVMNYANMVSQNEAVTLAQLKYETLRLGQSMDMEAITFTSSALTKKAAEPTADALQKQFSAHKTSVPFDVTAENPYGFGYKQPPRVKLEWMLVKLSDVAKLVPVPTAEQAEDYYQRNQRQFMQQVPSDPNDPNSQKVEKLQNYADVAPQIAKLLLDTRIAERADAIFASAREIADANLAEENIEKLTTEQTQKLIGNYAVAAEKTGKQYGLTVHVGTTGFVSPEDIARNEVLGRLFMMGQDQMRTPLVTMVFAVDELKASRLSPFAPAKPLMYESIGTLNDYTRQTVGLVRIIGAEKAGDPCTIDVTYARKLPVMKDDTFAESNDVYAIKDAVKEDIKKLESLAITKQAADALMAAVPTQGWDKALAAVNKQYGIAPAESNKPIDTFKVEPIKGLRRISEQDVKVMQARAAHDPLQSLYIKKYGQQKELVDKFYSLLEPDKTVATNVPMLVEYKPDMSYYVIKSMSRTTVDPAAYQQMKGQIALMQGYVHGQSLGFEHFKADNILKRMKFEWDEKAKGMPVRSDIPPDEDVL